MVSSPLWEGVNLYDRLKSSSWGKFMEFLKNKPRAFTTLPRIVVIGSESSGKSSLIENISKVAFFPRDQSICTKFPIRLIINPEKDDDQVCIHFEGETVYIEKDKVLDHMTNLMKSSTTISNKEIVVTVFKKDFPAFEVIDLPGIREYPQQERQQTKELVLSYITHPDTLILVVVPATTHRLTANQAIGLVTDVNKEDKSIICLTMADLLPSNELEEKLVKRLLHQTDELSTSEGWAGVVAVINRHHRDSESLRDLNTKESDHFDRLLRSISRGYHERLIEHIRERVTVEQVVCRLDQLFHRHICENWKPRAIKSISDEITECEHELSKLGSAPSTVNPNEVSREIVKSVRTEITSTIGTKAYAQGICQSVYEYDYTVKDDLEIVIRSINHEKIIKDARMYLGEVCMNSMGRSCEKQDSPLQVHRFYKLHESLRNSFVEIHEEECKVLEKYLRSLFDDIRPDTLRFTYQKSNRLTKHILIIVRSIGLNILDRLRNVKFLEEQYAVLREELPEIANKRTSINSQINDLHERIRSIEELDISV